MLLTYACGSPGCLGLCLEILGIYTGFVAYFWKYFPLRFFEEKSDLRQQGIISAGIFDL
jgi:hypothetical protein